MNERPTPLPEPTDDQPQAARLHGRSDSLVASISWDELELKVQSQQRNREVHTPSISLFRWWARRPHALIGAILDAASQEVAEPLTISDPFSGGGTVALEAVRRGFATYAQDLHPWAIAGLRGAIEDIDAGELELAGATLLERLRNARDRLYGTSCPLHGDQSEVLTGLWVRVTTCPCCSTPVYLYPYSYISRASRAADEQWGWWGCRACGTASRSKLDARDRRCRQCRRRLAAADHPLMPERRVRCTDPYCQHEFNPLSEHPEWELVLVQRACLHEHRKIAHFDVPTTGELKQATGSRPDIPRSLAAPIPSGLETAVLRRAGLRTWSSLYTSRQLESLLTAARLIDELECSAQIKNRLRLAVCGAAEMAGHISRWDRYYPKAFEAVANHRFAVTGLSAEVNLLADRGRGVLSRRIAASVRAARWRHQHLPGDLKVRRRSASGKRVRVDGALLAQGSSTRQLTPDSSVDLVLTDPPYFDDVQYAELAALFLAWAQAVGLTPSSVEVDLKAEAVANTRRGTDAERYRQLLTAIFTETSRSLKPAGRMVLTFHNTDLRAWWALGRALYDAGFKICALAVALAENDADHSKRGRHGFTRDLVIECRHRSTADGAPLVLVDDTGDSQTNELIGAGRAVAAMQPDESHVAFRERYRALRGPIKNPRISPTEQERSDV